MKTSCLCELFVFVLHRETKQKLIPLLLLLQCTTTTPTTDDVDDTEYDDNDNNDGINDVLHPLPQNVQ